MKTYRSLTASGRGGFFASQASIVDIDVFATHEPVKTCHKLRSRSQNCDKKTTLESGKGQYKQKEPWDWTWCGVGFWLFMLNMSVQKKTFIASCWETRAINRPKSYPLTSFWSSLSDSSHYVSLSFSMIVFTSGVFPLHLWQITIQTLHHGSPILAEICLLLFTWANFCSGASLNFVPNMATRCVAYSVCT